MKLKQLKQIGKDMGLPRVDLYTKRDKNELIERIKKGTQLRDYAKNVLLENAQDKGILVNATMSKETILKKITNPTLRDFNEEKLRELASQRGIVLKGTMPKKDTIKRIETPAPAHYTIESLKKLAKNNNIPVRRNIKKPDLFKILQDANLITRTPGVVDSNIGVRFIDTSLPMIRKKQKTPISAWEDVMDLIEKLPNKLKYASMSKTIKLVKELQKKMEKAKEEHDKLFEATETESALRNFTKVYTINGIDGYDGESFLNNAEDSITKVLRENRQTKVKLILKCKMIKEGPDGEIIRPFDFHSGIMLNIGETDENELYDIMIETIKEKNG